MPTTVTCIGGSVTGAYSYYNRGTEFVSTDGTTMTFIADSAVMDNLTGSYPVSGYLYLKDGTRYRIENGRPRWISDRNGNLVRLERCTSAAHDTEPANPCTDSSADKDPYDRPVRIVDPLGRTVTISYATPGGGTEDRITFQGATGDRTIHIRYAPLSGLLRDTAMAVKPLKQLYPSAAYPEQENVNSAENNPQLVQEVELPNGQKYPFRYNEYGELARATLPAGGYYEYDWAAYTAAAGLPFADGIYGNLMVYRRLKERRVYVAGALEGKTVYDSPLLASAGPNLTATATEQDAGGNPIRKTVSTFWGTPLSAAATPPLSYPIWKDGKVYQEELQQSNGTLVRRITNTWKNRDQTNHSVDPGTGAAPNDPRITRIDTLLGGMAAATTFEYSLDAYQNVTEKCESDYAAGVPQRCTKWGYQTGAGQGTYTDAPVHLRGLVSNEQIGTKSGDTFTKQTETRYAYDEQALVARTGISEHDPQRGSGFTARGNLTTLAKWIDTEPGADPWARTTYVYDIAGNVTEIQRPKVKTGVTSATTPVTTADYTDSYDGTGIGDQPGQPTYAFPTTIHHPGGLTTTAKYFYKLGRIATFTDPNGRVTGYEYGSGDPLDRLTKVTHPIGWTSFQYTPSQNKITVNRALDANRVVSSDSTVDGLGRIRQTVQPGGGTIDTRYDAAGRVYQVSNPYLSGTPVWTAYSYDELDRPLDVTYPDGAVARTRYSNNIAVSRDPGNSWTKITRDAFGRIQDVFEDAAGAIVLSGGGTLLNSGADLQTSYTYDARDNLTEVTQGGRNRSFSYDSLNRLRSASSPETGPSVDEGDAADGNGSYLYAYDLSGNLTSRTDPKSMVTSWIYDVLSRPVSKTYSDGVSPGVTYCYDGVAGGACAGAPVDDGSKNLKGRLTLVSNGVGSTLYTQYDALGRPVRHSQKFGDIPGQSYDFVYGYNYLAADSIQYPSRRQVNFGFDAAGRTDSVGAYATGISYAAHGPVAGMTLTPAAGSPRYEATCFNNRLQPSAILLRTTVPGTGGCTDTSNNLAVLSFDYGTAAVGTDGLGSNNGNVMKQTIGDGANWTVTQSYGYDKLNRLEFVQESSWRMTFGHDRWGNGWVDPRAGYTYGIVPDTHTPQAETRFSAKNRLRMTEPGAFDRAGNQLRYAPFTLAYDAEGRMLSASSADNGSAAYSYDGEGRRVKRVVNTPGASSSYTVTTYYVYDATGQLAAEYESGEKPPGAAEPPCMTCFLLADPLGSTRALWDGTGVRARYDYLPFGEPIAGSLSGPGGAACAAGVTACYPATGYLQAPLDVSQAFTGKERDAETGLDYFGARYFSAAQGRFTSPDTPLIDQSPGDPQSWNLYSYARNNPLKYVDPTGEAIELVGTEEERKKQLEALQAAVGAKAGAYLYSNPEKDKKGNLTGRYFVGVLSGGPSGKGPDFGSINAASAALSGVIADSRIAQVRIVNPGERFTYFSPTNRQAALDSQTTGLTSPYNEPSPIKVWVLNPDYAYDDIPGYAMFGGEAGARSLPDNLMHELGHAAWQMDLKAGRRVPPDPYGNQRAVDYENYVRLLQSTGKRRIH